MENNRDRGKEWKTIGTKENNGKIRDRGNEAKTIQRKTSENNRDREPVINIGTEKNKVKLEGHGKTRVNNSDRGEEGKRIETEENKAK